MITIRESWDRNPWMMFKEFLNNNIFRDVKYKTSSELKRITESGGVYVELTLKQ